MSQTPAIKFESPAESLVDSFSSTPGTHYSSLFPEQTLTPQSFDDESMFGDEAADVSLITASEKKPVKKRKSWGQQLPEPKTNLPPRKRAKTEDEKEQRRVERVLRNRRAAQSSRERKRQEVEALEAEKNQVEQRNRELEARLAEMEARNTILQMELEKMAGGGMRVFQGSSAVSSPAAEQLRASTPVTFSQELFSSQPTATVNPASLSPEIRPVPESSNASSSDTTQHPAEMLSDLQCLPEEQRPWMSSPNSTQFLAVTFLLNMISTATSTLLSPLSQIVNSLSNQSYLSPTPSILTLIIWMVTTTASLTTSTSMTSYTNTKTSQRPRFSLRMRLLRRLLACNPHLARPLLDATMAEMRLASEQQLTHACSSGVEANPSQGEKNTPSLEVLTTLCWAIIVISGERPQDSRPTPDPTTELRQACDELDVLFRQRNISGSRFAIQRDGQKSFGYRRLGRHS